MTYRQSRDGRNSSHTLNCDWFFNWIKKLNFESVWFGEKIREWSDDEVRSQMTAIIHTVYDLLINFVLQLINCNIRFMTDNELKIISR